MLSTDVQLPSSRRGPTYELEQISKSSKSEILRKIKQRFGAETIRDVRLFPPLIAAEPPFRPELPLCGRKLRLLLSPIFLTVRFAASNSPSNA
jgi:hypothetical protein